MAVDWDGLRILLNSPHRGVLNLPEYFPLVTPAQQTQLLPIQRTGRAWKLLWKSETDGLERDKATHLRLHKKHYYEKKFFNPRKKKERRYISLLPWPVSHQPVSDMKDTSTKEFSMAWHSIPESPPLPSYALLPSGISSEHTHAGKRTTENGEKSDCVVCK